MPNEEYGNEWERHVAAHSQRFPAFNPGHNFRAMGSGRNDADLAMYGQLGAMLPESHTRATEDAQAVGFLTNNLLAIQTQVDEIMYTSYRLPMFISIDNSVAAGAQTWGVRVRDRTGRARRVTAPAYDAPMAGSSQTLDTIPVHYYGLDAAWSIDELRGAMMGDFALDTENIEAAVMGTLEHMEDVGLTGAQYDDTGLLNQPTSGTGAVTLVTQASNMTFNDLDAVGIRNLINGRVSNIISVSKETLGRNVTTGMSVYLPGEQYDTLTTRYIGDNAEKTLMRSILEDNPWSHFTRTTVGGTGSPLMIHRVIELEGAGGSSTDRMIVALKHKRVAEMGVAIPPRLLTIKDEGRVMRAMVEAKFTPLFVKRPLDDHVR